MVSSWWRETNPRKVASIEAETGLANLTGPVDLTGADDHTVAGRALDGDVHAFTVLVRRHTPILRAYARRLLVSDGDVDDVVQDAFIAAWQQLSTIDDLGAIRSWLMRTVSHKSVDRIRAKREYEDIEDHEQEAPAEYLPENRAVAQSREQALAQVLSRLPDQQRQCWTLKESSGFSYDEIAAALELPTSTVRGLLARARKTVIKEMEEWR